MKSIRLFLLFTACSIVVLLNRADGFNLLYNFEGDSGTTVTDKLTNDGAQNGTIYNNVSVFPTTPGLAPGFGSNVAFFDNPPTMVTKDYSTIEVPETTFGDNFSITLSGWVYQDPEELRRFRIFSSFAGTGAAVPADRILFDAGNNETRSDVRAVIGGISYYGYQEPTLSAGYHHYAMTVDNTLAGHDKVKVYINGQELSTNPSGTLGTYSNSVNLKIGEDVNQFPQANSANEQIVGNVDDMLVLGRALSASDIASIYNAGVGATISSIVNPQPGERAIYYDFEGDSGSIVTDKFTLDGSQNGLANHTDPSLAMVDNNPANAKFGNSSFKFGNPVPATTPGHEIFSQIDAGAGNEGSLGQNFTLSAVINPYSTGQTGNGVARVFSSYLGSSSTAGQLIVDFNPNTATGIRVFLPSNTGSVSLHHNVAGAIDLDPSTMQTLTVVYESGSENDVARLYLDGVLLREALLPPGTSQPLDLKDLRIGEDRGDYFGARANENFIGTMDDIMVLNRALTAEQVEFLHLQGADALIATLPAAADGDFNNDGRVDGRDFLAWQRGSSPNPLSAADLAEWQTHYGNGALAANVAIPEPSTLAGALVGLMILIRGRTMARESR